MESDTAKVEDQNNSKKGEEATKLQESSLPMIKRQRIGGIEFRPKETDGTSYDAFELVLKGKIVGFLYL